MVHHLDKLFLTRYNFENRFFDLDVEVVLLLQYPTYFF